MKKLLCILLISGFLVNHISAQSKTIDSLKIALKEAKKKGNDTTVFYVSYGLVDYYINTNIDSTIFYINETIKICKRHHWIESEIDLYTQLGFVHNIKGNVFQAISYNYEALMLAEREKKTNKIYPILRVLGESYQFLKQYTKAKGLINRALLQAEKVKDLTEQCACLTALGNIEQEQKHNIEAEGYFRKVIPIALKTNEPHLQGIAYHNLASVLSSQKRIKEAMPLFEKSLIIHKKENHQYSLSNLYADLAELHFNQKSYTLSINAAQKSILHAEKSNSTDIISKANYWLYKNYRENGFYNKAIQHYEKHILLKDSLSKEDFAKRINSLQFEYENVQKATKIAAQNIDLLRKNNENLELQKNRNYILVGAFMFLLVASFLFWNRKQLRKLNETLEAKVAERTTELATANQDLIRKNEEISEALFKGQSIERKRVASELHDNLSSLLSAVKMSLQAIKTKHFNETEKKIYIGVLDMMNNAYKEVRNISHNILPEELEREGLVKTLGRVIEKINLSQTIDIVLESQIDDRFDSKIEFNFYSICLELLNNIIKHSRATKVIIIIQKTNSTGSLTVRDNGKGIKNDTIDGIGLSNIRTRADALNGEVIINSKENIGTQISVSVPI